MFGNLMQTSPLSGELKIELFNQGTECDIIEIDATGIKESCFNRDYPIILETILILILSSAYLVQVKYLPILFHITTFH